MRALSQPPALVVRHGAQMFRRHRTLPPPLDLDWPMKAWEDAELELRYERAHLIVTIEHELVRGVTPVMLG